MLREEGFTLIELLIVVLIIAILAAIAVPGLLRARMPGNEASAIVSLRTISAAQVAYAASCGGGGYAASLTALATAPTGSVPFVPSDLGTGSKQGYTFAISPGTNVLITATNTCNGVGDTYDGFFAAAAPLTAGMTGVRYFATDQTSQMKTSLAAITTGNFSAAQNLQ